MLCTNASIIPFIPSGIIPVLKIASGSWKKVQRTKRKENEGKDRREGGKMTAVVWVKRAPIRAVEGEILASAAPCHLSSSGS